MQSSGHISASLPGKVRIGKEHRNESLVPMKGYAAQSTDDGYTVGTDNVPRESDIGHPGEQRNMGTAERHSGSGQTLV